MARILVLAMAGAFALILGAAPASAQKAYITNLGSGTVSVISAATNQVVDTITVGVGADPYGLAVTPNGGFVYVANYNAGTVSVISTATNQVVDTVTVGSEPVAVAVTPNGNLAYVANSSSGTVTVIATANQTVVKANTVIETISVGSGPAGVAVTPNGSFVYVANDGSNTVSVISTETSNVVATIPVGRNPGGIAVTPDGSFVYVANFNSNTVSVIETATNKVVDIVTVGSNPFGVAVAPSGNLVYVADSSSTTVSEISTATNQVVATITVGSDPSGVAVTPDGSEVYVANFKSNTVSVIATASNTVSTTIAVGKDPKAYGNFIGPPTLTVAEAGNGQVTSSPANIDCGGGNSACAAMFPDGTHVTLTASAASGSAFAGWSGNGCSGIGACAITPTKDVTVTATFTTVPSFSLSVAVGGAGSGTVTSNPSGISCGSACSASFKSGAQVVLTAAPASGSTFAGWSGAGCSGTGTCTVTMSAAESVSATFTAVTETLTVTEAGAGAGQVVSSPAGINCSATSNQCAAPFAVGTPVTLTASARAGSVFTGWSGSGCSGTGTCQVTLSAGTTVTASFEKKGATNTLSVALTGGGAGTVTSSPSGINCGATCAASFQTGTQIALSAAAAGRSTFAGWSGGGCSGIDDCTLTLSADTTVTAGFVADTAGNLTLVAAVLPTSRSVEIGATPTAFATMIDAGPADATTCTIAPATGVTANFLFQTTDPSTNAVTGTANTPANIAAGQAGTFVIAFTPTAAFPPTNVAFTFTCANAPAPAASITGVNTLNLSASTQPVPDIVALAASGDPGYVDIPGATGTGVFAVATVNLGIDATITASANTGAANLPVTLLICQTDPTSGTCLAAPSASVATDILPNATPTFGIFVTGSSAVADMPGVNRIFVTFTDAGGTLRGETSVAVRMQ
jgi:YVTN family beta-propeller protein